MFDAPKIGENSVPGLEQELGAAEIKHGARAERQRESKAVQVAVDMRWQGARGAV